MTLLDPIRQHFLSNIIFIDFIFFLFHSTFYFILLIWGIIKIEQVLLPIVLIYSFIHFSIVIVMS